MGLASSLAGGFQTRNAVTDSVSAMLESYQKAGGKVSDAVNKVNPEILKTAGDWGNNVMGAGENAATGATDAANAGITSINNAVTSGQTAVNDAVKSGQGAVSPFIDAGTSSLASLTKLLQNPQQFTFQADPGYQFRIQEGQKAINRSAAAKGAAGGGGTAKALASYNSGMASQEYGNAWSRWNETNKTRQAGLTAVAGMGEKAGEFSGDLGVRGSSFNAGLGLTGANAGAALGERAAEYGGAMRTDSTKWAGTNNINATNKTSDNTLNLANFLANMDLAGGQTQAWGNMTKAGIWNQMIGAGGKAGGNAIGKVLGDDSWLAALLAA